MRILTVRQPWAWAIIHGGKDVENRVRNIAGDYRGPVAIHVAMADAEGAPESVWLAHADHYRLESDKPRKEWSWKDTNRGSIIGVVDLTDVHSASVIDGCGRMDHDCPEHGTCRKHCSEWAFGPHPDGGWYTHLVLNNPRPLSHPVPYKGALGLRQLDAETASLIELLVRS